MKNVFQLSCNTFSPSGMTLHSNLAKSFGFESESTKQIRFGSLTFTTNIHLSDDLPFNGASLSAEMADKLNLPLHCSLEVMPNNSEILIGPFIGLLISSNPNSLKQTLDHLLDYLYYYREIKGAIIAFSLENVDKENHRIKGFLFNPKTKKWEEGMFPYPSSIFVMTSISQKWMEHFQSIIGDTVFNHCQLNRWGVLQALATSIDAKNYLPESILYETAYDLYYFLKKYTNVSVSSIDSTNHSLIKVMLKDRNSIAITTPNEVQNFKFYKRDQAYSIFNRFFKEGESIIHESIDVTGYSTIPFRVIIVKNQDGQWEAMGMFSREKKAIGGSRTIYPLVKFGKDQLKELLKLSDLRISLLYHEITHIALDAIKSIDTVDSHIANAAVDMIIGEIGDVWITDIEHLNPSHEIALVAGYPELYYEILKMNMLYAKKLAGF